MSYFGNHDKDQLLDILCDFLKHPDHTTADMMEVVTQAIERKEGGTL